MKNENLTSEYKLFYCSKSCQESDSLWIEQLG